MSIVWANPEWLKALLAIPVLIAIWVFHAMWSARARKKLGIEDIRHDWIVRRSPWRTVVRNVAALLALYFGIVAMANPQQKGKEIEVEKKGLDIVFAIDLSKSMLAEDIAPSRLEQAKQFARKVIDLSASDRIGIAGFSGAAYKQLPITSDHGSAKFILNSLEPNLIPSSGSDFAEAIRMGTSMFDKNVQQDKVLIIISDGEDHPDEWKEAVESAIDSGLHIFTVGIGTSRGGPIPTGRDGKFHRDKNGEVVVTKREDVVLREIAEEGMGEYFDGNNSREASMLIENIKTLQLAEFGVTPLSEMEDQFQIPLGIAILFLLIRTSLSERSSQTLSKWLKQA
ncbi:vWA domain-containing protein [Phaeocystidibacter luteus]|uniref:VWA domain-containing protein n=1 Tax=Phaeocystidibacter luteus TaxID=911197 RepID=A0A6N6RGY9_9FLAO|nr:VWA domain-containing protein [Phaeocystidibacter luteus]KAB2808599.1 VWA domain-containing protein [Phaeocystidibacter luteus]